MNYNKCIYSIYIIIEFLPGAFTFLDVDAFLTNQTNSTSPHHRRCRHHRRRHLQPPRPPHPPPPLPQSPQTHPLEDGNSSI